MSGDGTLNAPLLQNGKGGNGAPHVAIGVGGERPSQVAEGVVPILLETRGLNYYLSGEKGQEKRILKDVSLRFSSGVLTAVMGCVGLVRLLGRGWVGGWVSVLQSMVMPFNPIRFDRCDDRGGIWIGVCVPSFGLLFCQYGGMHSSSLYRLINQSTPLHMQQQPRQPPRRPSGAGKTTLLNLLTGNAGGRIEGGVEVNGRPLKEVASRFKKLSTTVPQVGEL
jgi:hypothetical protein